MGNYIVVHIGLSTKLQGGTELVIRYHLEFLEEHPEYTSYSIYPKDLTALLLVTLNLREIPGAKPIASTVSYLAEITKIALDFINIIRTRDSQNSTVYIVSHYPQYIWMASLLAGIYTCKHLFYNHQAISYLSPFVRILLRASIPLVDTLIVLNSSTAKQFSGSRRRFSVLKIKNPSRFKTLAQQDDLQARPKVILLVARDHPVKQIDIAIQAFKLSRVASYGWTLHILGSNESRYSRLLTDDAVSSIKFTPYTEDISAEYHQSRCTLCSSSMEEFGMTIIEGFSFGLPSIVFKGLAGPSDFVKHNYNGLVARKPNSIKHLASMIRRFCRDSPLQSYLAQGAYLTSTNFEKNVVIKAFYDTIFA